MPVRVEKECPHQLRRLRLGRRRALGLEETAAQKKEKETKAQETMAMIIAAEAASSAKAAVAAAEAAADAAAANVLHAYMHMLLYERVKYQCS